MALSTWQPRLVHEALVYSSDEEYAAALVPFLLVGLEAGEPAIVVARPARAELLRDALGEDARDVSFRDAVSFYARPAQAIAEYRRHLDEELSRPGVQSVRVIGEVEFGSTEEEHRQWTRYESVLNQGLGGYPARIVCPYDARTLAEQVVAGAHCTHPTVSTRGGSEASLAYVDPDDLVDRPLRGEEDRGGRVVARAKVSARSELDEARRVVAGSARAAGLAPAVVDDVTTAVGELVRDALGTGKVTVLLVRDGARWSVEVTDGASDRVTLGETGLAIARLIGERVEVTSVPDRRSVRLTFSGAAEARQRILDAASELFYQHGIRATGVNAVVAHSGVAKATFFRQFPAKDDLVLAWLGQSAPRWFDRIRAELDAVTEPPAARLLTFFDLLGEWFAQDDFRGCAFQNAAAEVAEAGDPIRLAVSDYELEIRDYLRQTATEAGLPHPSRIADQVHVLVQGAIAAAVAARSAQPASVARSAAAQLLQLDA